MPEPEPELGPWKARELNWTEVAPGPRAPGIEYKFYRRFGESPVNTHPIQRRRYTLHSTQVRGSTGAEVLPLRGKLYTLSKAQGNLPIPNSRRRDTTRFSICTYNPGWRPWPTTPWTLTIQLCNNFFLIFIALRVSESLIDRPLIVRPGNYKSLNTRFVQWRLINDLGTSFFFNRVCFWHNRQRPNNLSNQLFSSAMLINGYDIRYFPDRTNQIASRTYLYRTLHAASVITYCRKIGDT